MKIIRRIIVIVGIILAVISIALNIYALVVKECSQIGNITLALALVVFAVESFLPKEDKPKKE